MSRNTVHEEIVFALQPYAAYITYKDTPNRSYFGGTAISIAALTFLVWASTEILKGFFSELGKQMATHNSESRASLEARLDYLEKKVKDLPEDSEITITDEIVVRSLTRIGVPEHKAVAAAPRLKSALHDYLRETRQ